MRILPNYPASTQLLALHHLREEIDHVPINQSGTFALGDRTVKLIGNGARPPADPGVFGPPKDRVAALAVLRQAVAPGENHIDTSDFYGPHFTDQLIREALHSVSQPAK